ncbi:S-layer homology domain-containing protein [Sporosarcina sp. 179-K 8C2 HS]|uniref:S-layer homology domain-containing protein n=1 Tax=Sporosarcina sp. 179-K 8C2 HS TaxID=3142387 RepID=UPI0039A08E3F
MGNNQPKKYRNFMIGAASAALVATAVAPVASAAQFTDVKEGNTHAPAINALVEAGVISGYPDGTFQPNKTLTRSDVVKMMGKWLESLDYKVPTDYKTNPRFKDLTSKSNDELLKYAALVKDNGVFNGYADGTLGAGLDITRENMAIVLVRAYDAIHKTDLVTLVKETEFDKDVTDLAKAKAEARPYIDVLDYFDITNPVAPQFNPKSTTTRGQFASFLYKTSIVELEAEVDTEAPKLVYTGEKTLNVEYGKEFTAPVVTATDNVDEEIEVTSVITNEAGERLTAIDTKVPGTYKVTYSAVDAAGNSAEDLVVTVVVGENPVSEVVSVNAVNAKQVEIKFNNAVEKNTVVNGNGDLQNITISRTVAAGDNRDADTFKGELSKDGKTLTITAVGNGGAQFFSGSYAVTVTDDVKDAKGKALKPFSNVVTVDDKVAPTVSNVEYDVTNGEITVTLSEPVKGIPSIFRVNGSPIAVGTVTASANNTKFTFAKPASVASGSTASVYVTGVQDYAGNQLEASTSNVVITKDDTELQVVSAKQLNTNSAEFVFNKAIATSDNDIKSALSVIIDGTVVSGADINVAKDVNDARVVKVTYTGTSSNTTGPNYFYGNASSKDVSFVFAANQLKDVFGKELPATTKTVTMNKDVAAPMVVSTSISSDKKYIELKFDKQITSTTNTNRNNVTLRKDGVAVSMADGAVSFANDTNGDQTILRITPNSAVELAGGEYTVRLPEGFVNDSHGNASKAITASATKAGVPASDLTATITNNGGTPNVFQVEFSEDVTAETALNLNNYKLDGKALPAGTDIYFKSGAPTTRVVIELGDESINFGNSTTPGQAELNVSGVKSTTGKTVKSISKVVDVADNTAATLVSAKIISNSLELTFDEAVNPATLGTDVGKILADLQIKSDAGTFAQPATGTPATVVTEAGSDNKKIVITVTAQDSNWTNVINGSNLTVTTKETGYTGRVTNLVDVNGVKVKAGVTVSVLK